MSESQSENLQPQDGENKTQTQTPAKRTPSKRRSMIERAQRESEELIKNMGGSLDVEGGRKTRSSTRGTAAQSSPVTPPPAKKPRTPASTPSRRGRHKKVDTENEEEKKSDMENVTIPKKDEKIEKEETKLENCKNDDDDDDASASNVTTTNVAHDEKGETEVDAKMNSSIEKKEKLESISEGGESQESQDNKVTTPKSQKDSLSSVAIDKQKSPEITSVPESKQQQLDKVEPMEVDGVVPSSSVVVKTSLTPTKINTTAVLKTLENATRNEPSEGKNIQSSKEINLSTTIEKNDLSTTTKAKESVTITATVVTNEKESQKTISATENAHGNSINEKQQQSTAEYLTSETKKEESNKSGNDNCEPKISTPSSPGEVVAAQPCN